MVNLRVGVLEGEFQDADAVVAISTADGSAVGVYNEMTELYYLYCLCHVLQYMCMLHGYRYIYTHVYA